MKWTLGNSAYVVGLLAALAMAVMGAGLGAAAMYVPALIFTVALVVAYTNISAAEGQKFLLLAIAQGVVGLAAISGTFSNLGLKVFENVVVGVGQYFLFIAIGGVLFFGHKMYSKK